MILGSEKRKEKEATIPCNNNMEEKRQGRRGVYGEGFVLFFLIIIFLSKLF